MHTCRIPQFDPNDIAHNMRMLPCGIQCIEKSAITGFTLTNQVGTSIAVHFSPHEEYLIALFCFRLCCLGYHRIHIQTKPTLMVFLAERFESEALRDILAFIFNSHGDIFISPIRPEV